MNHLREFIETATQNKRLLAGSEGLCSGGMFESIKNDIARADESAVCFDFGDYMDIPLFRLDAGLAKPPFDVCWFEFSSGQGVLFAVLMCEEGLYTRATIIEKSNGEWILWAHGYVIVDSGDIELYSQAEIPSGADYSERIEGALWGALAGVCAMNCTNVSRTEHGQPEKLQKARAKRGKKPLFSYWTLELKQERTEGDPLGGTHASPRLHLRRGHPRQYAPGKYTWVQPCVVGNKAAGMVHKDYRLSA